MNRARTLRQIHRVVAPIMVLPLVLTLLSGSLYQFVLMAGQAADFRWLMNLHTGDFGVVNLRAVYPFLNALGLLVMIVSGIGLWLQARGRGRRRINS